MIRVNFNLAWEWIVWLVIGVAVGVILHQNLWQLILYWFALSAARELGASIERRKGDRSEQ